MSTRYATGTNTAKIFEASGSHDGALAASSDLAILAYCAGAALGARPAGTPAPGDPVWPRRVTDGLAAEFVFMAAYAVGWWTSGSRPGKWVALALLLAPPAAPLFQLAVLGTVVAVGGAVAAKR